MVIGLRQNHHIGNYNINTRWGYYISREEYGSVNTHKKALRPIICLPSSLFE